MSRDSESFEKAVREVLQKEFEAVTEEFIERTKRRIEDEIRRRVTYLAHKLVDNYYSIKKTKGNIVITIRHFHKETDEK